MQVARDVRRASTAAAPAHLERQRLLVRPAGNLRLVASDRTCCSFQYCLLSGGLSVNRSISARANQSFDLSTIYIHIQLRIHFHP